MTWRARAGYALLAVPVAFTGSCVGEVPSIASPPDGGADAGPSAPEAGACRLEALRPRAEATSCVPRAEQELTATPEDDDCDGYTGNLLQGDFVASGDFLGETRLALGPLATPSIAGEFWGTAVLGGRDFAAERGVYMISGGSSGETRWSDAWGGRLENQLNGLAINGAGQTLLYAAFSEPVDFGKGRLDPGMGTIADFHAAWGAFDAAGGSLWSRMPLGRGDAERQQGVVAIGSGRFGLVYSSEKAVTLSEGDELPPGIGIVLLDAASGAFLGHFPLSPTVVGQVAVSALVSDGCENLYLAGTVSDARMIAGTALGKDFFLTTYLLKLRPEGESYALERLVPIASSAMRPDGVALAVAPDGSVFLATDVTDAVDLGGACDVLPPPLSRVSIVLRFDSGLSCLFARSIGGQTGERLLSLAVDTRGNSVVSTETNSAVGSLSFLSKLDPSGALIWQRDFSASPGTRIQSVAIDATDEIHVLGDVIEGADFGDGVRRIAPPYYVGRFLAKYAP